MAKIVFLTGTDTEVGKTVVSSALLQCATEQGYQTVGYKPVASGSEWLKEGLRNSDALTLQKFSTVKLIITVLILTVLKYLHHLILSA